MKGTQQRAPWVASMYRCHNESRFGRAAALAAEERTPQQRRHPIGCTLCRCQSIQPGTGKCNHRPQYPCTWLGCSGHNHEHSQCMDTSDHRAHLENCRQKCTCGLQPAHTQASMRTHRLARSRRRTPSVNLEAWCRVCTDSAHSERQQKMRWGSTRVFRTWCSHLRSRHRSRHQLRQHIKSRSEALSVHRGKDLVGIRRLESSHRFHTRATQPVCDPGRMCNHTHQRSRHYTQSESAAIEALRCMNWPHTHPPRRCRLANRRVSCLGGNRVRSHIDRYRR
jgi:hypothetical protein